MNMLNIISEIEKRDPEVFEKISPRRKAMKEFANFGGKVALASIPFALGSMFKKAYGGPTDAITDVLQFALTLEYLEAEYYTTALAAPGLTATLTGAARGAIQTISAHETAHVAALKATLQALGTTPVAKPTFDFSAGSGPGGPGLGNGPLSGANSPFVNYAVFLAVAQTFEDTGVRAYKGQAGNLITNNDVLTAALQIHSVEARHASHIRQMRRATGLAVPAGVTVKPWITLNQSGVAAPFDAYVQSSYNGEEVTSQANVNIMTVGGNTFSAAAASEAFDEPLTKAEVLAIVDGFIV
ncbi:MAG: dessication-associated protein [Ferruginibacter sp.]|nr:dessication-associated protein [Ferruginibacter sp.]